jgi:hypothetical protein
MAAEQKQALAVFNHGVMFAIDEARLTEPIALSARSIASYKKQENDGAPKWPKTRRDLFESAQEGWRDACLSDCLANWERIDQEDDDPVFQTVFDCSGGEEVTKEPVRRQTRCGPGMR